jgi:phosphoglycerate dehydrogenase-like enzyme
LLSSAAFAFIPALSRDGSMTDVLILTEVQESMRARYKQMLLERFPQLKIDVVGHHSLVDPYIANIDILLCFSPPMADHVVREAKKLKWIQALGTGVDNIVDLPSLGKEVLVTNVRGIHGAPVSEAALAYMLSLARDMPRAVHEQDQAQWQRWPSQLLTGKTVGILGVGLIAEYLAPVCQGLGMTVIGFTGTPRETKGFDRMLARDKLIEVAPELDFLVALVPLSAETRNMVGRALFKAMKPSAYLVNVARGGRRTGADRGARKRRDRGRRARRVLAGAAAARQSDLEGKERADLLASRRLLARLRRPRDADHRRQHGLLPRRPAARHDQHRAQACVLGRMTWPCPNA